MIPSVRRMKVVRDVNGVVLGGVLLAWAALAALLVNLYHGQAPDDLFVTYRYALNLAEGHGFVYNSGERVFGLSNPGLGLLLALLHVVTAIEVPTLATLLTGLCLLAGAAVLLFEGHRRGQTPAAAIGGTLLVASPYVWPSHGGAAPLVLALLLTAALLGRRWPVAAGLLAGLAVWCRPDAIAGAGLLGLLLLAERKRLPWRYTISCFTVVLLGLIAAESYFETPLPITVQSKRALADLQHFGAGEYWLRSIHHWRLRHGGLALVLGLCGAAGLVPLLRRGGRATRLLALYGLAIAIAYPMLGIPFFSWYVIPVFAALYYGLPHFALSLGRALPPRTGSPEVHRAAGLLCALVLLVPLLLTYTEAALHHHGRFRWQPRLDGYHQAGEWIRKNTEPEATVTLTEIGVVGYFSRRPVRDLMGLVTPEALEEIGDARFSDIFRQHPTELVVWNGDRSRLSGLPRFRWFRRRYRKVASFPVIPGEPPVVVYQRRPRFPLARE